MNRKTVRQFAAVHFLLAALTVVVLFVPKARHATLSGSGPMLAALALIELFFLVALFRRIRKGKATTGICDVCAFLWLVLLAWELYTSVWGLAHPVLVPSPENVFNTFREQWRQMLTNVLYSLELLLAGFSLGMIMAVLLGLAAGWVPRLREFSRPIANVLSPIPAVVFSPYLVSVMPSFRSASAAVIFLGVFWPNFLSVMNRVQAIEPRILDSARMLNLASGAMIFRVLLPSVLPGLISGLKISLTTSLLMLNFAELMGATHGLGYYVQNSITYANYTHAIAGIIMIGMVVTVLNALVGVVQARCRRWK